MLLLLRAVCASQYPVPDVWLLFDFHSVTPEPDRDGGTVQNGSSINQITQFGCTSLEFTFVLLYNCHSSMVSWVHILPNTTVCAVLSVLYVSGEERLNSGPKIVKTISR